MLLQQFSANPPLLVKRVPGAMKISYGAVLPLPPGEAFAFVADPIWRSEPNTHPIGSACALPRRALIRIRRAVTPQPTGRRSSGTLVTCRSG